MKYTLLISCCLLLAFCKTKKDALHADGKETSLNQPELYRPQFHFTPDSMWMNDPNGLVYYKNTYHLFYQYYPKSTVWGPMHWGHATSSDMISWTHQPIALYPDEHGYIFSGSAVLDSANTSGLGTADNPPLVAIFTYHNPAKAKAHAPDVQSQGIAYSLDDGNSWKKYDKNPVLLSPGIPDFRDPKVRWYPPTQRWIMTLAVKNHIRFYSSPNLIDWQLESMFGKEIGAHGGVWECPDLFPLTFQNQTYWILIVNLNPGGPNGGSATQYFVGDFDGQHFTPADTHIRWLDYGPDEYAGVTWSNTGTRTLFIGWMSNWKYATKVPTVKWRSAMTLARELSLDKNGDDFVIKSAPVPEFDAYAAEILSEKNLELSGSYDLGAKTGTDVITYELDMQLEQLHGFQVLFSNENDNELSLRYDAANNNFTIDRSHSGEVSFHKHFADKIMVPRWSDDGHLTLRIIMDVASMELFADEGSTVSTTIFFPKKPLNSIKIVPDEPMEVASLTLKKIK